MSYPGRGSSEGGERCRRLLESGIQRPGGSERAGPVWEAAVWSREAAGEWRWAASEGKSKGMMECI